MGDASQLALALISSVAADSESTHSRSSSPNLETTGTSGVMVSIDSGPDVGELIYPLAKKANAHIPRLWFRRLLGQCGPSNRDILILGQAKMSIRSMSSFAAPWLCLLALATGEAHASREVHGPIVKEVGPRAATLTCVGGLTDAQSRACEDAAMRWGLCQRVYLSESHADDAFSACFEGAH